MSNLQPDTERSSVPTQAPEQQLDAFQSLITQLYFVQDKQLKEVREILQKDYNVSASERMFKTRIKKWGLDKRRKGPEMMAIVRKAHERAARGKESTFTIRGGVVDLESAKHFFKRKGIKEEDLPRMIHDESNPRTPPDVRCTTPEPEDTTETSGTDFCPDSVDDDFKDIDTRISSMLVMLKLTHSPLEEPEAIDILKRLPTGVSDIEKYSTVKCAPGEVPNVKRLKFVLFHTEKYVSPKYDRMIAARTDTGFSEYTRIAFRYLKLWLVFLPDITHGPQTVDFRKVHPAFDELKDILQKEHPWSLKFVFSLIIGFSVKARSDLLPRLLGFISEMAKTVLGQMHPVTLVTGAILDCRGFPIGLTITKTALSKINSIEAANAKRAGVANLAFAGSNFENENDAFLQALQEELGRLVKKL